MLTDHLAALSSVFVHHVSFGNTTYKRCLPVSLASVMCLNFANWSFAWQCPGLLPSWQDSGSACPADVSLRAGMLPACAHSTPSLARQCSGLLTPWQLHDCSRVAFPPVSDLSRNTLPIAFKPMICCTTAVSASPPAPDLSPISHCSGTTPESARFHDPFD